MRTHCISVDTRNSPIALNLGKTWLCIYWSVLSKKIYIVLWDLNIKVPICLWPPSYWQKSKYLRAKWALLNSTIFGSWTIFIINNNNGKVAFIWPGIGMCSGWVMLGITYWKCAFLSCVVPEIRQRRVTRGRAPKTCSPLRIRKQQMSLWHFLSGSKKQSYPGTRAWGCGQLGDCGTCFGVEWTLALKMFPSITFPVSPSLAFTLLHDHINIFEILLTTNDVWVCADRKTLVFCSNYLSFPQTELLDLG